VKLRAAAIEHEEDAAEINELDEEAECLLYVMEVEARRRLELHVGMLKDELKVRKTSRTARKKMISHSLQRWHCIPQKLVVLRHRIGFATKLINIFHFCLRDSAGGTTTTRWKHHAEK
jgi:hypothetical protein